LMEYQWPGNVRELANVVERAMILAGDNPITAQTLSFLNKTQTTGNGEMELPLPAEGVSLDKIVQDLAKKALKASGNNQTAAARLLGLSRAKFRVLLRRVYREI
jgi:DNA-binding NtrC family response regulator